VRERARSIIVGMIDQTAEDRLPALLQLLLLLARDAGAMPLTSAATDALPDATEERISRVLSYLHKHYQERNPVAELTRIAALSRSSLHRLFRQQTRMTVTGYITHLRIGKACALLIQSDKAVSLIADQVGYQNLANFNRQFKLTKGQTPRGFRKAFQSGKHESIHSSRHRTATAGSAESRSGQSEIQR
jgi:transcriptional regulator GlxA family with amidase domain